jgi:hypothetical protein
MDYAITPQHAPAFAEENLRQICRVYDLLIRLAACMPTSEHADSAGSQSAEPAIQQGIEQMVEVHQ